MLRAATARHDEGKSLAPDHVIRRDGNCVAYAIVFQFGREGRMEFDGFDWDAGNRAKCQKHGVSISEVEYLFRGTPLVGPDSGHSTVERRFRAIGRTASGRNIFVVFTWRGGDTKRLVRPVSARYMHQREVDAHEKEISRIRE